MRFRDFDPVHGKYSWFWLVILGILLLAGNARVGLWDQDEAAYAGFGRHMIETGDWLVPEYTWSEVHRKPPFHFWGIAISQYIFGENTWATRLPGAIAIWLSCFLLWTQASNIFGKAIGRWAALILGTSGLIQALGHISLTDSSLLLWQTLAALSLLHVVNAMKGHSWWFWLAIGLGALTKGPPIIIFSSLMLISLILLHPHRKFLFRFRFWLGLPLAVLPLFIWGYLAWQRDDGVFVSWLIDWYILKRVSGSVFGQSGPPGYHLAFMLLMFLPWLAVLPFAIKKAWKGAKKHKAQTVEILAWLAAGWLPYEIVSSKLPTYAFAAHPAFALLLAYGLFHWKPASKLGVFFLEKKQSWLAVLCAFYLLIWGVFLPQFGHLKDSSLMVKASLEQHFDANAPMLIGQSKAMPPSLPFYLEKHHPLSYNINPPKITKWTQENPNGGLILNFEQAYKVTQLSSFVPIDTVSWRTSGKNTVIDYVILKKGQ